MSKLRSNGTTNELPTVIPLYGSRQKSTSGVTLPREWRFAVAWWITAMPPPLPSSLLFPAGLHSRSTLARITQTMKTIKRILGTARDKRTSISVWKTSAPYAMSGLRCFPFWERAEPLSHVTRSEVYRSWSTVTSLHVILSWRPPVSKDLSRHWRWSPIHGEVNQEKATTSKLWGRWRWRKH